jgi:SAM-dependent methyltransferase
MPPLTLAAAVRTTDQAADDAAGGGDRHNRMSVNSDQQTFWSTDAGDKWVAQQAAMDTLLAPVLDLVLSRAGLQSGDQVLDIGCGAGTSTLHAADQIGVTGHATGLDISHTLLAQAAASENTSNVSWLLADAQTHPFAPNSFDALISRFGVMFFADTTAAFSNIARAVKSGGTITMAAWAAAPDNPWFMVPAAASRAVLGPSPKTDRTQPGPFAFEDPSRIIPMLEAAGLHNVTCTTHQMGLTSHGTAQDAADLCCEIGPADNAIRNFAATPDQQRRLRNEIATRLTTFQTDQGLHIPGSIHLYQARVK